MTGSPLTLTNIVKGGKMTEEKEEKEEKEVYETPELKKEGELKDITAAKTLN